MTVLLGALLAIQLQLAAAAPPVPTSTTVQATRTAEPPVLDGKDEDVVWRSARPIDGFLEAKRQEWEEYRKQVSQWEVERYLGAY